MNHDIKKKKKDREEIELISDYEIQWGEPSNWPEEIIREFDQKWDEIQEKYKD